MDLELRLREAVAEQDPGDEFTARVMHAVDGAKVIDLRTRRRSRIIVPGVLLSVAAAAAALVAQLTAPGGAPRGEVAQQQSVAQPLRTGRAAMNSGSAATGHQSTEVLAAQVPSTEPPQSQAPLQSTTTSPPAGGSGRITLMVMPVADRSGAPGAGGAAEAFRAQLVRDFRGMSDLVVLDSTADPSVEAQADFRLHVSSLEWRRPTPGVVEVISTAGATYGSGSAYASDHDRQYMAGLGTEYWPLEARIEDAKSSVLRGKTRDFTVNPFVDANGVRQPETSCSTGGSLLRDFASRAGSSLMQWAGQTCGNTTAIARGLVEIMRQEDVPVPVAQPTAWPAATPAISEKPGYYRRPMPDGLRTYLDLMGIADSVERAVLDGSPSTDSPNSFFLQRMALNDEELVKLDQYLRSAIRSDRDNQAKLSEEICSRKAEFRTLDEFGMAMNELSRKSQLHQENLGLEAAAQLGPEFLQKMSRLNLGQSSRETTTYDYPAIFRAQQRDLQTEVNRLCSRTQ